MAGCSLVFVIYVGLAISAIRALTVGERGKS
jgi:hypothetical protein